MHLEEILRSHRTADNVVHCLQLRREDAISALQGRHFRVPLHIQKVQQLESTTTRHLIHILSTETGSELARLQVTFTVG